jgi:hypothetical protein
VPVPLHAVIVELVKYLSNRSFSYKHISDWLVSKYKEVVKRIC